ncbi:MAG TPA: hypothetical protein VM940_11355, partial [Chthoniobacterales bacterium]|nr:hypothetical protein [Chthoniobacterales bacterium]
MKSKFFTLANSSLLLIACCLPARGQGDPPAAKMGYIRFWDMAPATNGSFEVCKVDDKSGPSLLSGTAYQYSSYIAFPPGAYRLAVYKKGNRDTALKTFSLDVKPETFFTIIVSPQAIEAFVDTNDPK